MQSDPSRAGKYLLMPNRWVGTALAQGQYHPRIGYEKALIFPVLQPQVSAP